MVPGQVISQAFYQERPLPKTFLDKARKKDPEAFRFLHEGYISSLENGSFNKAIGSRANDLLEWVKKQKEAKQMIREAELHKKGVEKQWNGLKEKLLPWIEELSGFQLPDFSLPVYVLHPKQRAGHYIANPPRIYWATGDKWKNYSSVYMCHEIMHFLTEKPGHNVRHAVLHAIIELATDNEIRIRLNKAPRKYTLEGHVELKVLREKCYPHWKKYLEKKTYRNILELAAHCSEKVKKK